MYRFTKYLNHSGITKLLRWPLVSDNRLNTMPQSEPKVENIS